MLVTIPMVAVFSFMSFGIEVIFVGRAVGRLPYCENLKIVAPTTHLWSLLKWRTDTWVASIGFRQSPKRSRIMYNLWYEYENLKTDHHSSDHCVKRAMGEAEKIKPLVLEWVVTFDYFSSKFCKNEYLSFKFYRKVNEISGYVIAANRNSYLSVGTIIV